MMRTILTILVLQGLIVSASAVGLRQVIRDCGPDGKRLCQGVSYGAPMQACLSRNKAKLTPVCKAIVDRLDKGEKVTLFGG